MGFEAFVAWAMKGKQAHAQDIFDFIEGGTGAGRGLASKDVRALIEALGESVSEMQLGEGMASMHEACEAGGSKEKDKAKAKAAVPRATFAAFWSWWQLREEQERVEAAVRAHTVIGVLQFEWQYTYRKLDRASTGWARKTKGSVLPPSKYGFSEDGVLLFKTLLNAFVPLHYSPVQGVGVDWLVDE